MSGGKTPLGPAAPPPPGEDVGASWATAPNRDLPAIEAEFDGSATLYENKSAEWDYRGARDGSAFFARHVGPAARVLDAGCGSGLVGQALARRGFSDLTGCDVSAGMLRIARAKGVYGGGVVRGDIRAMPFPDARFDALVCIAVLTYAPEIEPVFAEFHRLVRPGGRIVFTHRVDLEGDCGFGRAVAAREAAGAWHRVERTDPMPYYPRKADYADRILIRYWCFERRG